MTLATWPECFADPASPLATVMRGLAAIEAASAIERTAGSRRQRALLVQWAAQNVPAQVGLAGAARALFDAVDDAQAFESVWRELPLMRKASLRDDAVRNHARGVPPAHLPLGLARTSGSTGIPVSVRTTGLTRLVWSALTLREHLWQRRDFTRRLGVIRFLPPAARDPHGVQQPHWGHPVAERYPSGPASVIHIGHPIATLARWLGDFDPHYLLASPSVLAGLLEALPAPPPALTAVRSAFEPLDADLVARLRHAWGVTCADIYSANETGYLALACAEAGALHVQDESAFVEILDEAGQPCAPGSTGRVVVTPLHNLATPLLRYDLGDYATVGAPCPCGRAAAVLGAVRGRVRNLACAPDGTRFWPVSLNRIRKVAAVRQAQFVQTARERIELRVVLSRGLAPAEEEALGRAVREALGHPYEVAITPVAAIARGPTGKFEEFLSLLEP